MAQQPQQQGNIRDIYADQNPLDTGPYTLEDVLGMFIIENPGNNTPQSRFNDHINIVDQQSIRSVLRQIDDGITNLNNIQELPNIQASVKWERMIKYLYVQHETTRNQIVQSINTLLGNQMNQYNQITLNRTEPKNGPQPQGIRIGFGDINIDRVFNMITNTLYTFFHRAFLRPMLQVGLKLDSNRIGYIDLINNISGANVNYPVIDVAHEAPGQQGGSNPYYKKYLKYKSKYLALKKY